MSLKNRFDISLKTLQSLSSIKSGQYWNTNFQCPQNPGYMTSIYRSIFVECREINLEDIKTSIESAFALIEDLYTNEQYDHAIKIQNEVLNSRYGILNLKTIYYDSEHTKQKIDNIVLNIKNKFLEIREIYKNYPVVEYNSPIKKNISDIL